MNVNHNSLQRVDTHWAVLAVGEAERDRGLQVARARLVKQAVGQQMHIDFPEQATDDDLLRRLAKAYEIAAIEGLRAFLSYTLPPFSPVPDEIRLVQNFLKTEISPGFELVDMLFRDVGVHHAGLSDEVRALIEWLAEAGKLRVLCATSTIAQGINFPVSSVFLASRYVPQGAMYNLEATRNYARRLADNPGYAELADMTGFSPEGVGKALSGLNQWQRKLTPTDWTPDSLFGHGSGMADLVGVMLRVPQLAEALTPLGGQGLENQHIAEITQAWVSGRSIHDIAMGYFQGAENDTKAITNACRAIYRNLIHAGTWGLSALSRLSGIDFDTLSESERRRINALPAMRHGLQSEEAVLMRMNSVPRSVAEKLGEEFRTSYTSRGFR